MAVEYMIFWRNFDNIAPIRLGTVTPGILKSLIMNLKSEFQKLNRRIQYGGQVFDLE